MLTHFIPVVPAQPQTLNPHAHSVNSQFAYSKSQWVSAKKRLEQATQNEEWKISKLEFSKSVWRSAHPTILNFNDIKLCQAQKTTLDKIVIDITLQRVLDIPHVCMILANFRQVAVQSIQVYRDPGQPKKWVCWDGQHTVVMLYIVACLILGHDPKDVEIPITVFDSTLKSEMRENFISLNGDAKKPLDQIDLFHQYLFGVRTDNSQNPKWLEADAKQQALETHGMFATHSKFGDTHLPGALSNLTEFTALHSSMVLKVCKYFHAVCGSQRAVDSREFWMMSEYFQAAERNGIEVTDDWIKGICVSLNAAFGGHYDPDALNKQAMHAYEEWWRSNKPNKDGTLTGIDRKTKRITGVFLAEQIEKYADPKLDLPIVTWNGWTVDPAYLF